MKFLLPILCVTASLTLADVRAAEMTGPTVEVPRAQPGPPAFPLARQALESFNRGDYSEAERLYTTILAADPKNVCILNNLGVAQFRVGKLATAEATLRRTVALAPHNAWGYEALGVILYFQGKLTEASDCFHWVLAIDPQNASARGFLRIAEPPKSAPTAICPWPNAGDFLTPLEDARLLNGEDT